MEALLDAASRRGPVALGYKAQVSSDEHLVCCKPIAKPLAFLSSSCRWPIARQRAYTAVELAAIDVEAHQETMARRRIERCASMQNAAVVGTALKQPAL